MHAISAQHYALTGLLKCQCQQAWLGHRYGSLTAIRWIIFVVLGHNNLRILLILCNGKKAALYSRKKWEVERTVHQLILMPTWSHCFQQISIFEHVIYSWARLHLLHCMQAQEIVTCSIFFTILWQYLRFHENNIWQFWGNIWDSAKIIYDKLYIRW